MLGRNKLGDFGCVVQIQGARGWVAEEAMVVPHCNERDFKLRDPYLSVERENLDNRMHRVSYYRRQGDREASLDGCARMRGGFLGAGTSLVRWLCCRGA